jgi:molybdate transport repressor ModE-like protein
MHNIKIQYSWTKEPTNALEKTHLVTILKSIRECGSINAAAKDIGFSYRHVWGEVKNWELELGKELVTWGKGQPATLTEFGERVLWNELELMAKISPYIDSIQSMCQQSLANAINPKLKTLSVFASYDPSITELQKQISTNKKIQLNLRFGSNVDALMALNDGDCLIAGFRTLTRTSRQGPTSESLRNLLNPGIHKVMGFVSRSVGLLVAKNNPIGIHQLSDLTNPKIRISRPPSNSALRTVIKELVSQSNLSLNDLNLTSGIETTDSATAVSVASGKSDVGFGLRCFADAFDLDFVPIAEESYRLVCLKESINSNEIIELRDFLRSSIWADSVKQISDHMVDCSGDTLSLKTIYPWRLLVAKTGKVA